MVTYAETFNSAQELLWLCLFLTCCFTFWLLCLLCPWIPRRVPSAAHWRSSCGLCSLWYVALLWFGGFLRVYVVRLVSAILLNIISIIILISSIILRIVCLLEVVIEQRVVLSDLLNTLSRDQVGP